MHLKDIQKNAFALAKAKGGWPKDLLHKYNSGYPDTEDLISKLGLVVCEAAEAIEEVRRGDFDPTEIRYEGEDRKPEGLPPELADIVLRVMNIAEALNIDLEEAIQIKHCYNKTRPRRHGGKRA